jgi:hypothetical protein
MYVQGMPTRHEVENIISISFLSCHPLHIQKVVLVMPFHRFSDTIPISETVRFSRALRLRLHDKTLYPSSLEMKRKRKKKKQSLNVCNEKRHNSPTNTRVTKSRFAEWQTKSLNVMPFRNIVCSNNET